MNDFFLTTTGFLICMGVPLLGMILGFVWEYRQWRRGTATGWHVLAYLIAVVPLMGLIALVSLRMLVGGKTLQDERMLQASVVAAGVGLALALCILGGVTFATLRRRRPPPTEE